MEFSNQKRSKKIKQAFNLTGILIVLAVLVFLWLKLDVAALITVAVFMLYIALSLYIDLCYVFFSDQNGKIILRYYPVISFLKKEYESIEFTHQSLVSFKIEKALGFSDLELVIKTKRGIAGYPTISLTALSKSEIEQISSALLKIMKNKK